MNTARKGTTKTAMLAVVAVATALFAFQPAEADAGFKLNIVVNAAPAGPGPGPGPGAGPGSAPAPHKLSCKTVRNILHKKYGFYHIKAYDCKGKSYWYFAKRKGHAYKIKISAFNAKIIRKIHL